MLEKEFISTKAKINYSEGPVNGPTVILLHALGASWKSWNSIISFFINKYHLIAIDLRGHGNSDHIKENYSWENYSSDIYDFINYNSYKNIHIIGHSLGGIIGAITSINHKSIKTLCMEDPPIFFGGNNKPKNLLSLFEKQMLLSKKKMTVEKTANEITKFSKNIKKDVAITRAKNILSADYRIWETILLNKNRGHYSSDILIKNINIPTLILRANPKKNGVITEIQQKKLTENKNIEIDYWEDSGHNMHSTFPKKFSLKYSTFLNNYVNNI